ncbi:MAG: 4Fe-4S cluster-binding domain-containing protein [Nitrososphaeria archaeon]
MQEKFAVKGNANSPWELNEEGGNKKKALVVRYAECNLKCPLCYAQSYAYAFNQSSSRTVRDFSDQNAKQEITNFRDKYNWVRIQGGEPLLNRNRALFTAELVGIALGHLKQGHSVYNNPHVIIQTNGVWLGNAVQTDLDSFFNSLIQQVDKFENCRVIIEVSFKGANQSIARAYSGLTNGNVFDDQKQAYWNLKNTFVNKVWSKTDKVAFYIVAGLGPELDNPPIIPIDDTVDGQEYPIFHPCTWSKEFKDIIVDFTCTIKNYKNTIYKDYINKHGTLLPMESLEISGMQSGWTSKIKSNKSLKYFIQRYLRIDSNNPKINLLKNDLRNANISPLNQALFNRVSDLKHYFYEAEPKDHYPYL